MRKLRTPRADLSLEALAVAALASVVLVVHPLGYVVHHPYWRDEAWVAVLSKAPLTQWLSLSSSTPLGWLLAVRWVPAGRDGLRVVPLAFSAGVVVMAYVVARGLPWRSVATARVAGVLAGGVVLLAPISLVRNDLKQYTSDAFFTLLIVAVVSRYDARPSRRNLVALVIVSGISIVFSAAAAFVVVAVFVALGVNAARARSRQRRRAVASAAAVVAISGGIYVGVVVVAHDNRALRDYWRPFYVPERQLDVLSVTWDRVHHLAPALAMPAALFVVLVGAGVIVLARFGRTSVALAVPILWLEMLGAGMAGKYPFLDQRTSHFLLIFSLTVAAIGVAGIVAGAAVRSRVMAGVLLVGVTVGFVHGAEPYIRERSLPNEDVRSQVDYVAGHYRPGDVVLVSYMSDWGFGYYWPGAQRRYAPDRSGDNTNGFFVSVVDLPGVVYAPGRAETDTTDTMRRALAAAAATGATGRVWLIRTYMDSGEGRAWDGTFSTLHLRPAVLPVGPEPLLLVTGG